MNALPKMGAVLAAVLGIAMGAFVRPAWSAVNVRDFGATGDGTTNDWPAFDRAFQAGNGTGVYIPTGNYFLDNSRQDLNINNFSGTVSGDGDSQKTLITCASQAWVCLQFVGGTTMTLSNFEMGRRAPLTNRTNTTLLAMWQINGLTMQSLNLHDTNSSVLGLIQNTNVTLQDITVSNALANGILALNNQHVRASGITSHDVQDAAFEVSYYDKYSSVDCSDIQVTGLYSHNDYQGILVNSCRQVTFSNFVIDTTYDDAVAVIQDNTTTTTHYPDQVLITSGTIAHAGRGAGPARPVGVEQDTLSVETYAPSPVPINVTISNLTITDPSHSGIVIQRNNPQLNVTLQNVSVSTTGPEGVGFDIGGNQVVGTDLYSKGASGPGFYLNTVKNFKGTHLVVCNSQLSNSGWDAFVIASAVSSSVNGLTLMDLVTGHRTVYTDVSPSASHTLQGLTQLPPATTSPDLAYCQGVTSPPPPAAPTALAATAADGSVHLSWTASSGATSYNVKRSRTSGSGYVTVGSPSTASYTDSTVSDGITYFYIVNAVNGNGESTASAEVSATPMAAPPPPPPAAPTGLAATAADSSVDLTWTATSGATSYHVKRSQTSGSGYVTVGLPSAASYTDTTVSDGVTYFYIVTAVNGNGESAASSEVSASPVAPPPPPPPLAPTGLSAVASDGTVRLTWTASSGATSYHAKRSQVSGSGYISVGSPTGTSFTDTSVSDGTTYFYVITAVSANGESLNSGEVSALPMAPAPPPLILPPSSVSAVASNGSVRLTWAASTGATGYHVKRSQTSGTGYTLAGSPTGLAFSDTGLSNGTTYYYVVTALGSNGESTNSSQVSAVPTAPAPPPAPLSPTGLSAAASNASVQLRWTASAGATGYHVKRSQTSGSGYVLVGSPTTLAFSDTGLVNGTTYYYVVTAFSGNGESASSSQVSAAPVAPAPPPVPSTPTGLSATASNASVQLRWTTSAGATSYHVKRSRTSGTGYTTIGSPSGTSYTDNSVLNGTTYYYIVTAVNANGESGNSSQVSALPHLAITPTPPASPTGVSATAADRIVQVTWDAMSGATGYHVKRSQTSGSGYFTVGSPASPEFIDSTVSDGTTYYYVVTSFNGNGESAASAEVLALPMVPTPTPPTSPVSVAGQSVADPIVYPNPWRADRHSKKLVMFGNLSAGATVKIFTVSGRFVKSLPVATSTGTAAWDLTTDSGSDAASGLYLYNVKGNGSSKKTGQIVIIR